MAITVTVVKVGRFPMRFFPPRFYHNSGADGGRRWWLFIYCMFCFYRRNHFHCWIVIRPPVRPFIHSFIHSLVRWFMLMRLIKMSSRSFVFVAIHSAIHSFGVFLCRRCGHCIWSKWWLDLIKFDLTACQVRCSIHTFDLQLGIDYNLK